MPYHAAIRQGGDMELKTIKQVSDLTGVSIRMLRYYDKIGLLEPSSTTAAGYRLYGEAEIETIQQILFLRELDFPLKEIRSVLSDPHYDRKEALRGQRELLVKKRDRLNALIDLIEREEGGSSQISFKEFDMTEYYDMLETFKRERADDVAALCGDAGNFDRLVATMKSRESETARMAARQFGSVEKFTAAIRSNLDNLPSVLEGFAALKKDAAAYVQRSDELMRKLTSDLGRDPTSPEIQLIVKEMDDLTRETSSIAKMDMGEGYWALMADLYLTNPSFAKVHDAKYGEGATRFIGEALRAYSDRGEGTNSAMK
jgi:DNA-binding transcriptional MerR regulator